jgi:hypothetical protein
MEDKDDEKLEFFQSKISLFNWTECDLPIFLNRIDRKKV